MNKKKSCFKNCIARIRNCTGDYNDEELLKTINNEDLLEMESKKIKLSRQFMYLLMFVTFWHQVKYHKQNYQRANYGTIVFQWTTWITCLILIIFSFKHENMIKYAVLIMSFRQAFKVIDFEDFRLVENYKPVMVMSM